MSTFSETYCLTENPRDLYNQSLQRFTAHNNQTLEKSLVLVSCLEALVLGSVFWTFDTNETTLALTIIQLAIMVLTIVFFALQKGKYRISTKLQKHNDIILSTLILAFFIFKLEIFLSFKGDFMVYIAGGMTLLPVIMHSEKSITSPRTKMGLMIVCILYALLRELIPHERNAVVVLQLLSTGLSSYYFFKSRETANFSIFTQNYILLKKEASAWQRVLKDVPEPTYIVDPDLKVLFTNVLPADSEKFTIFIDSDDKTPNHHDDTSRNNSKTADVFKFIQRMEIGDNKDLAKQFFTSLPSNGGSNLEDSIGELLNDKLLKTRLKTPIPTLSGFNTLIPTSKNESGTLGCLTATKKSNKKFKNWLRTQSLLQVLAVIAKNAKKFQECYGKSQLVLVGRIVDDTLPLNSFLNFQKSRLRDSTEFKTVEIKISLTYFQKKECLFIMMSNKPQAHMSSSVKSMNEYKVNLLASFSHELRTPLNGNLNFLEAALQRPDVSDEIKNDYLSPALTSAKLLFYIISDILDYSQFSLDKITLSIKRFKIESLLNEVVELFKLQARKKNLKISLELEHNFEVYTDFTRLCQVLVNLVSNALKFTYDGGIQIGMTQVSDPPNCYKIFVKDTGIGISNSQRKKLEKIFKGENTEKTEKVGNESVGSNLGLTTSSRLAVLLGPTKNGGIAIEHQKKGTKMAFLIENKKLVPNERSVLDLSLSGLIEHSPHHVEDHVEDYNPENNNNEIKSMTFFHLHNKQDDLLTQLIFRRSVSSNEVPIRELRQKFSNDSQIVMTTPEEGRADLVGKTSLTAGMARIKFNFNNQVSLSSFHQMAARRLTSKNSTPKDAFNRCKCNSILIVDDDSFNLMAAEKLFGAAGLTSMSAFHGMQAIEIIEAKAKQPCGDTCQLFKFILMDCNMPVMDGYEATQNLKMKMFNGELPQIPIVGCTAFVTHFDAAKCFDSGMDDYVTKPLSKEKINRILEKWARIRANTQVMSPGLKHEPIFIQK